MSMLSSLLLVRTGQQCVRCDSLTTTSFWYRAKTCGFADTGYVCSKCFGYLRDRQLGIFKDVKNQRALRRCSRCDSNKSLEKATPEGYKFQQWHSLKGSDNKWLCHDCWSKRQYEVNVICQNCKEHFLTTWLKKYDVSTHVCTKCTYLSRTTDKVKHYRDILPSVKGRKCYKCKSKTTRLGINRRGVPYWRWYFFGDDMQYQCSKCYDNEYRKRHIKFKEKQIYLGHNPKTGYCSWCSNNIHDKSCKATQMHHIEYHDNEPLKDAIELCPSCHRKETIRLSRVTAGK